MNTKKIFNTLILSIAGLSVGIASVHRIENPSERKLKKVTFNIENDKVREVLEKEKNATLFKLDQKLDIQVFENERTRIEQLVQSKVDNSFSKDQVKFLIDTTASNTFIVETVIKDR